MVHADLSAWEGHTQSRSNTVLHGTCGMTLGQNPLATVISSTRDQESTYDMMSISHDTQLAGDHRQVQDLIYTC